MKCLQGWSRIGSDFFLELCFLLASLLVLKILISKLKVVVVDLISFSSRHSTVAPLLSPVHEVSISPNDITIEMHMHAGPEVCHFILSPM